MRDSVATNSTIKIKHTQHYEIRMRSNKIEYSTAAGVYCTTHDFKVTFCMPYLSSRKIIEHHFHVKNDKILLGICYKMIIGHDLMVGLGLLAGFKRQVLQLYGVTVPMK